MGRALDAPVPLNVRGAPRALKRSIASAFARTGLLRLDEASRGNVVLAVGYHGTPAAVVPAFTEQLAFFRDAFECLGEAELGAVLRRERKLFRPGIVLTFDDGVRDQAEVAAPLLERFGLRGWFMVPGAALSAEPPDSGPSMTWAMARSLVSRGHVVGCHTWSHATLGPGASEERVMAEVTRAKERFEENLGHAVRAFAWVRGRPEDYSRRAHDAVSKSFTFAFTSLGQALRANTHPRHIHRFHIEADYSLPVVRLQLSRFNEWAFASRRRAVEATLGDGQAGTLASGAIP